MPRGILYKYRDLKNFERLLDIFVNERFWSTTFENMNDPMEGIYYSSALSRRTITNIKHEKEKIKICAFSKNNNEPLLWAHYADGARGVCFGLEVTAQHIEIRDIIYDDSVVIDSCLDTNLTAKEILTHKLKYWRYEGEVRVFTKNTTVKVKIKEVILGDKMSKAHKKIIMTLTKKLLPGAVIIEQKNLPIIGKSSAR